MDAVDEVKSRLSIEDIIGEYVQLKRAGRNFRGLSPFTNERTPSFMVSPEKQIWHDFSSSKGGNMFSFIMEIEGLDFKGALELLARKAGVDLDQYKSPGGGRSSGPDKQRLLDANDAAAKFYQVQLKSNREALDYVLTKRLFSKETVLAWRLGYSPNNGSAIVDYLIKKGFSEREIQDAGLSTKRNNRYSDMFRGRLMIPLADPQGQVIGFTARALKADDIGPKYINTPRTVLYDKSRHIFGMHFAKQAIRENKYAVIVEGNLDVIMSHQAGVKQVVATAGTALTEANLKNLNRFVHDIRLAFDGDKAGLAATERSILLASRLHVSLNIIDLKGGKDPDELIKKDPALWLKAIDNCHYAIDWLIDLQQKRHDLNSAAGKREFSDELMPLIANLDDAVEQDHYLNSVAATLGVSKDALDSKLKRTTSAASSSRQLKRAKPSSEILSAQQIEISKCEDHLLSLMQMHPEFREQLEILEPSMLSREPARQLLKLFKQSESDSKAHRDQLAEVADYVKILMLQYEELYQGLELSELKYEAARLQVRLIEDYVKNQKNNLVKQMSAADERQTDKLLAQARRLDELLRDNLGEQIHA
ncbi:MAG: DNA primase [Candidatus Saccharimonadales bacterium]